MATEVAVYGKESSEKTELINSLANIEKFTFLSSTPKNRHRFVDDGLKPPFHLAPLQILYLDLDKETQTSISSLERNYRLCDFERPLMIILNGKKEEAIINELNKYHEIDHIIFNYIDSAASLSAEHISHELEQLDQRFCEKNTSTLRT
ncbi:MAG: hypothetical protein H0T84_11585 [Tatlockia sp.]|nr:hypothetical protein [Tatlockia sp.]